MFTKILIANRGAIACRIIRTLKRLGITAVAVYSEADAASRHVREADEAYCIGPALAAQSYLRQDVLLDVAKRCGAQAIHPGYGFLSENAGFAQACEDAGIAFIGPTPAQMRAFGLKHTARALAQACEVPLLPGSGLLADVEEALREAQRIGYPVMLKSTAGGGGIGMRRVFTPDELADAFAAVQRLASANFKDAGLFLEKFVEQARHIEVQIFGDGQGGVIALGERDCSVQRRNQKVVEETPAPGLSADQRAQLHATAVRLAQQVAYRNAGTVEFVLDAATGAFYFLEVNTRLQVEHGVTEQVTGVDLVAWMVQLAAGELPPLATLQPRSQGASIQVRVYAEDPARAFQPSTGVLTEVQFPATERVDTWVERGTEVTAHYDPMLAKLIVTAPDRPAALARLQEALASTRIAGIETNLAYLRQIVAEPQFQAGQATTAMLGGLHFAPQALEVLEPGVQTTVQDWPGRLGHWDVGVPPSGPMGSTFKITDAACTSQARPQDASFSEDWLEGENDGPMHSYFGYVETLTSENGLSGWVASYTPEYPPDVCLVINGEEVARLRPDRNRPDIWQGNQLDFCSGFNFDVETLMPLLLRIDISPAEPLAVVVADTHFQLSMRSAWQFRDLVAVLQTSQSTSTPVVEDSLRDLAPHLALDKLMRQASRLMLQPLRTDQAQQQGLIECMSVLADDLLLISGWWSERLPTHLSAILVAAGRKTPAALCCLTYPRSDLPEGHCGFTGLLRTAEGVARTRQKGQFVLGLSDHLGGWVDTLRPLRIVEPAAGLKEFQRLADARPGPHAQGLFRLAREFLPWAPASDSAGHLGCHMGLDGFDIAPRFGILLSGWVLSPTGVVTDISARVGETVYLLDPMSLAFSPRKDLGAVFPALADRADAAGFSAVLRGHAPLDASMHWTLRLRFSDHSVLLYDVPMARVRVMDQRFDWRSLERTHQHLESAPWLRDLVDSTCGQRVEPAHPTHFGPVLSDGPLLIYALPAQERHARLALDRLERHLGHHTQASLRVLLVLPPTVPRGLCTRWIEIIRRHHPMLGLSCSLLPADANAWQVLPSLLRSAHAQRFAFIGPDVLLTESGANAMITSLLATSGGPCFLRVGHIHADQTRLQRDAQAFIWNATDFMQYRSESPVPIGGFWSCNGMSHWPLATDVPSGPALHALRLRSPWPGPTVDRINRRLFDPTSAFWNQTTSQDVWS